MNSQEINSRMIKYILFCLALTLAIIFYLGYLLEALVNFGFVKFFFIPIFSFLSQPIQTFFDVGLLMLAFFLANESKQNINSYASRFVKSFVKLGPFTQHYLIAFVVLLPFCVLIFNRSYYQSMFVFKGDFLIFFTFTILIGLVFPHRKESEELAKISDSDDERPIATIEEDIIGFNPLLSELLTYLISRGNGSPASTVAVIGDWGAGKTSLLNLIHNEIEKEKKKAIVKAYQRLETIYFNVAQYEDINSLYIHFYNEILKAIERYYILPPLMKYNLFRAVAETIGKDIKLNFLFSTMLPAPDISKYQMYLSSFLKMIDISIVLLVDDIDRIRQEEMDGVFKLLRLISGMNNITLIFASEQLALERYSSHYLKV